MPDYTARIAKINDQIEGSIVAENGFVSSATPGQYLVIESTSGERVWAYECDTLEECARVIGESDTERESVIILDLDKLDTDEDDSAELVPILEVTRIMGGGLDWIRPATDTDAQRVNAIRQAKDEDPDCEECGHPESRCACYQEEDEEEHDDTPSLQDQGKELGSYGS